MQLIHVTAATPEIEINGNAAVLKWREAGFAVVVDADGNVGQFTGGHTRFEAEIAVVHLIDQALAELGRMASSSPGYRIAA